MPPHSYSEDSNLGSDRPIEVLQNSRHSCVYSYRGSTFRDCDEGRRQSGCPRKLAFTPQGHERTRLGRRHSQVWAWLAAALLLFTVQNSQILQVRYSQLKYAALQHSDFMGDEPNILESTPFLSHKNLESVTERKVNSTKDQQATRTFKDVKYQGLTLNSSTDHQDQIHVYHIAKEFGPASMGGLGMVVTALASAQQQEQHTVNVVMPHYSFLNEERDIDIAYYITLSIDIRDEFQELRQVRFQVHSFQYFEAYDDHALSPVTVWLIGPGDIQPFDRAFNIEDAREIYFEPKALPSEWRDLYFCKAAATFLRFQSQTIRSSKSGVWRPHPVDVIHLHGATNALILHYLQPIHWSRHSTEQRPALVYTLHDYLDELLYSNRRDSLNKFDDGVCYDHGSTNSSSLADISKYHRDDYGRLFTSSLGIDLAHASTFVSKTMTKDIVEGRIDFYLKELVLDSILDQAERNLFIGITNGIDIRRLNPWTSPHLCKDQLAFPYSPLIGGGCASKQNVFGDEEASIAAHTNNTVPHSTIRSAKEAAKRYLISKGFLTEQDFYRPLILFIGRFQYNKGIEFFKTASSAIGAGGGKFVIMGQPSNVPTENMPELSSQFDSAVEIISDIQGQRTWGIYLRAAADFLFVPSLTESFGLVAAEGLLFGSTIISSGVGGLTEFLVDKPLDSRAGPQNRLDNSLPQRPPANIQKTHYNSYFFDAFASDAHSQLSTAIHHALQDWRASRNHPIQHEAFLTKLLESALAMSWDRPGGPVAEYRALYQIALNLSR